MRDYLRQAVAGLSSGAMPAWQRWLCGIILTITAPIWVAGLAVVALVLAVQDFLWQLTVGKGGRP